MCNGECTQVILFHPIDRFDHSGWLQRLSYCDEQGRIFPFPSTFDVFGPQIDGYDVPFFFFGAAGRSEFF